MQTPRSLFLVLIAVVLLSGCDTFQQRDRTYQGDPQLEFAPLTAVVDEGAGTVTTRIQLIGPQRDQVLPVSFVVADSSTAVAGVHYQVGSTSTSIEADSSTVDVSIDVLDNTVDDGGTTYELFLILQDSENAVAAENLKAYTLTIRGANESAE